MHLLLLLLLATASPESVLDDFHLAASQADEERYFRHLADDAIFIGSDATERWDKKTFREYAHPHFAAGRGWTYKPRDRHVAIHGDFAIFDELLDSTKYGVCRGTGVLRKENGRWRIVQYVHTIPVPNDVAMDVVSLIRQGGK